MGGEGALSVVEVHGLVADLLRVVRILRDLRVSGGLLLGRDVHGDGDGSSGVGVRVRVLMLTQGRLDVRARANRALWW